MNKRAILSYLQSLYIDKNLNITQYLRGLTEDKVNTLEDILISYDFQAGSYTENYDKNPQRIEVFIDRFTLSQQTVCSAKITPPYPP